jgi:hypothetical protein
MTKSQRVVENAQRFSVMLNISRASRVLLFLGVIFLMIAWITPDRSVLQLGTERYIITRESTPLIYWGSEAAAALIALTSFVIAYYLRGRHDHR